MILATSAVVAVLYREPEAVAFAQLTSDGMTVLPSRSAISAAN